MLVNTRNFMYEFAEETTPAGTDQTSSDGTKNTDNKDGQDKTNTAEHMIPKSRFDEVNQKFKDLQSKLEEFTNEKSKAETERQKAEKKAKEEQGKYEELYKTTNDELGKFKDDHKNSSQRVTQLETVINAMLETRLANVPEDFRDLVPANLNPEAKLEWLTAAESKGLFKAAGQKMEWTRAFFKGDSANPNEFDGLQKRLAGAQIIDGKDGVLTLAMLDELIGVKINGLWDTCMPR